MNKHVQIRNLPEAQHRKLKQRAAAEGMTITDYVKKLIETDLRMLSWDEFRARMASQAPVELPETTAEMIRRERDSR